MGKLTNDMTRLCNEIKVEQDNRAKLLQNLGQFSLQIRQNIECLRTKFAGEREKRAQKMLQIRQNVVHLRQDVVHLRQSIGHLRAEFATDLASARAIRGSLYHS